MNIQNALIRRKLGKPQEHDHLLNKEIVRPTNYFTFSDFGHKQKIWEVLHRFDTEKEAEEFFNSWREINNENTK